MRASLAQGFLSFSIVVFYLAMTQSSRSPKPQGIPVQTIVISAITWGVLALFFYLLFGIQVTLGEEADTWYAIGTYVFEQAAYLGAALLCFRNWENRQMVSGRTVWLLLGLGTFLYFLGNFFFGIWELMFGLDPDISLGDLFFLPCYICLAWGMVLAILPRRLNMGMSQWGLVVAVGILGAFGTYLLINFANTQSEAIVPAAEALAEVAPANAPGWANQLDQMLSPLAEVVGKLYIIADVALLVIAFTLLLAFWGGRFAQSWRMIAAASFCLYVSDIWFYYATTTNPDYISGQILEVGWVFSAILFAIGAALEYDVSTGSTRRGGSRRRSAN
jgi:hypothetical protein